MSQQVSDFLRVGQIAIVVHDVAKAEAFYKETLGLQHLFSVPSSVGQLAFFNVGGTRLMLSPPERPEHDHKASTLYFDVADIRATYERLRAKGVRFEGEPHFVAPLGAKDLWMAFFYDMEDNLLALQCEIAR